MLKNSLAKGLLLGLIAGILTAIFDSLYMLSPDNMFIPYVYPFALVTFNVLFWSAIGFFAGFAQWLFCKGSANFLKKEHLCWIVFFLLPFALLYNFLGGIDTVGGVFEQLPYFGSYTAFYLMLLFIASLLFFTARGRSKEEFSPFSFVFAILIIILLFHFGYNILTIPIFSAPYNRYINFFQPINVSRSGYFTTVYIAGITLIAVLYFTAFFKIKPVIERFATQHYKRSVGIVLIIVFSFLSGAGILSYSLYAKEHAPVIAPGKNTGGSKAPLVILIVLDTVRADNLSMYGYHRQTTKNLEEFARDALVFENCITNAPYTYPSHASLFTGLYPTEHGGHGDLHKKSDYFGPLPSPLSKDCVTLAKIFKQNGYKTAAVSSNYGGAMSKDLTHDYGFDSFDRAPNIGDVCRQHLFRPIIHSFSLLTNLYSSILLPHRQAEAITAKSLRSVGENGSSSFFLFINFMDAHEPYCPPPPYSTWFIPKKFPQLYRSEMFFRKEILKRWAKKSKDEFLISQYDGAIVYLDDHLGNFFEQLKRWGLYDTSLIIVTSDHGELFGEHGLYAHTTFMYEGIMHVPLLIKFPFSTRVGREKKAIQLTDVFSTILSISGLPIPKGVSGKPFGNSSSPAVGEFEGYQTGQQRVLYEGNYKLMHYERGRALELYDLDKDPQEQNNLANIKTDKRQELEHKLSEWIQVHKPRYALSEKESISKETIDQLRDLGYIQ